MFQVPSFSPPSTRLQLGGMTSNAGRPRLESSADGEAQLYMCRYGRGQR